MTLLTGAQQVRCRHLARTALAASLLPVPIGSRWTDASGSTYGSGIDAAITPEPERPAEIR
ncbi:hypothetical protein ACWDUI_34665, partial [Streptosporangium sandarakinum]